MRASVHTRDPREFPKQTLEEGIPLRETFTFLQIWIG